MNWKSQGNIGDILWHVNFLRKLGGDHVMGVKPEYIESLTRFVDIPVKFIPINTGLPDEMDCWIGNRMFDGDGIVFDYPYDIIGFLVKWFNRYSRHVGGPEDLMNRQDMLWGFPLPKDKIGKCSGSILVVNSPPTSGQCPGYNHGEVWNIIQDLKDLQRKVFWTNDIDQARPKYSLATIQELSVMVDLIICVANGPAFPAFNTLNKETQRVVFLSPMYLNYDIPARVDCVNTAQEARNVLEETGWL